eukprot:365535-Chlamydomonas_euryale.AAC.74
MPVNMWACEHANNQERALGLMPHERWTGWYKLYASLTCWSRCREGLTCARRVVVAEEHWPQLVPHLRHCRCAKVATRLARKLEQRMVAMLP